MIKTIHIKLICIVLSTFLYSCTSTKHANRSKSTTTTQEQTQSVLTQTITEVAKDTIRTPEIVTEATSIIEDSLVINTPEVRTVVKVNKGVVRAKTVVKARAIPVNIQKTTITHIDQSVKANTITVVKVATKDKHTQAPINFNWLWLIVAGIAAFWLWRISRK